MTRPYDPSAAVGSNGRLFGLPHSESEAAVVLLPVPWEATTSYRGGTARGPEAILNASPQLDLIDPVFGQRIWEYGVCMLPLPEQWILANRTCRPMAEEAIRWAEAGMPEVDADRMNGLINSVNHASERLRQWVYDTSIEWLDQGKLVGLVGGEHSCPLGLIEALAERYDDFGILQIDAHADLRETYENFKHSHASIFFNTLKINSLKKLIQVGLRDISPEEVAVADNDPRIISFLDSHLKSTLFEGTTWKEICEQIAAELPRMVYVSFDIDGLHPALCPNTGTPVPGGLGFQEAIFLLKVVVDSGRTIVGFDLCEVAPDPDKTNEWDANVGARILFYLCNALMAGRANA